MIHTYLSPGLDLTASDLSYLVVVVVVKLLLLFDVSKKKKPLPRNENRVKKVCFRISVVKYGVLKERLLSLKHEIPPNKGYLL